MKHAAFHADDAQPGIHQSSVRRCGQLNRTEPDWLAEEVPDALVYNGISHVVMMASPKELDAFALGFSLSEGIIASPADIYGIDIVPARQGLQVQVELSSRRFMALKAQRRVMAGRTGCDICGVEQLDEIGKPLPLLPFTQRWPLTQLDRVLTQLPDVQPIGRLTGCTHAVAWISPEGELCYGAEDVGRHVALDKLLVMRARRGETPGAVQVSSRASYEMVQNAAMCGVEILFAVSTTTSLAVEVAER